MTEETCLEGHLDGTSAAAAVTCAAGQPAATCPEGHAASPQAQATCPAGQRDATCPQGHAASPPPQATDLVVLGEPPAPGPGAERRAAHGPDLAQRAMGVFRAMSPAACPSGHPPPRSPIPAVLRTAALICWAALAGACGDRSGDPVRTAQAFTAAVQRGDMDAVYPLLERAATERLTAAAAQASDQVGGRRRIEPAEMLQIVDVDPNFELAGAELVGDADPSAAKDGELAQVRLLGSQQESHTLTLVREDGAWRVRIPLPPLTPTTTTP